MNLNSPSIYYSALICLLCLQSCNHVLCENGVEDETRLMSFLKKNLPTFSPPRDLDSNQVNLMFYLKKILKVDDKQQLWSVIINLFVYYSSNSSAWTPEDYGGLDHVMTPANTFWTPELLLFNAEDIKFMSFEKQRVDSDGVVYAVTSQMTATLTCKLDMSRFPFDQHTCPIRFGSPLKPNWTINGDSLTTDEILTLYESNDQWVVKKPVDVWLSDMFTDYDSYSDNNNNTISDDYDDSNQQNTSFPPHSLSMVFKLHRRPQFYSVFLIAPSTTLHLISGLSFVIPAESGEKISFAVTILLAEVFNFGVLADCLPASAHNLPIISKLIIVQCLHMCVICMLSALVSRMVHCWGRQQMPAVIKSFISGKITTIVFLHPPPECRKTSHVTSDGDCNDAVAAMQKCLQSLQQSSEEENETWWKYCAAVIDRFCLIAHIVLFLIIMIYYAIEVAN